MRAYVRAETNCLVEVEIARPAADALGRLVIEIITKS